MNEEKKVRLANEIVQDVVGDMLGIEVLPKDERDVCYTKIGNKVFNAIYKIIQNYSEGKIMKVKEIREEKLVFGLADNHPQDWTKEIVDSVSEGTDDEGYPTISFEDMQIISKIKDEISINPTYSFEVPKDWNIKELLKMMQTENKNVRIAKIVVERINNAQKENRLGKLNRKIVENYVDDVMNDYGYHSLSDFSEDQKFIDKKVLEVFGLTEEQIEAEREVKLKKIKEYLENDEDYQHDKENVYYINLITFNAEIIYSDINKVFTFDYYNHRKAEITNVIRISIDDINFDEFKQLESGFYKFVHCLEGIVR